MNSVLVSRIAHEVSVPEWSVHNSWQLFSEGATIPFVARYRKERTGSLDEVQLEHIKNLIEYYETLEKRKETICKTIQEQGLLDTELEKIIRSCYNSVELEDIYLPYKPKKKTRASEARAKGLEPLAHDIFSQKQGSIISLVEDTVKQTGLLRDDVLQGARDIIAEWISEHAQVRKQLRYMF
ncbi:MAG TPA: Tex-like N-terminal domain-containing protein, partial [Bacteroidales bacterium]|nr:Tex-like N-terminal domain-containing protein [Bacteroidales bacterium]